MSDPSPPSGWVLEPEQPQVQPPAGWELENDISGTGAADLQQPGIPRYLARPDPNTVPAAGFSTGLEPPPLPSGVSDEQAQRVQTAFESVRLNNSDPVAAVAFSKALGVDYDTALRNLPAVRNSLEQVANDPRRWVRENPILADMLVNHPQLGEMIAVSVEVGPVLKRWYQALDLVHAATRFDPSLSPEQGLGQLSDEETRIADAQRALDITKSQADLEQKLAPRLQMRREDAKSKVLRDMAGQSQGWWDPGVGSQVMIIALRAQEAARQLQADRLRFNLMVKELRNQAGPESMFYVGDEDVARAQGAVNDQELRGAPGNYGDNSGLMADIALGVQGVVSSVDPFINTSTLAERTGRVLDAKTVGGMLSETAMAVEPGTAIKGASAGAIVGGIGGAVLGAAGASILGAPEVMGAAARSGFMTGARAGGGAGFSAGQWWSTFYFETGNSYGDLRKLRTDAGQELTVREAAGGAVLAGVIKANLESLSFGKQMKVLGESLPQALTGLIKRDPLFRQHLAHLGAEAIESLTTETVTEGIQELADQAVRYLVASEAQGQAQNPDHFFNPEAVLESSQGGFMGSLMGLPFTHGHSLITTRYQSGRTEIANRQLGPLHDLAATKEAQAAPDEFAQAIADANAANGIPLTAVHVDPKGVTRYFQEAGLAPDAAQAELVKALGPDGPARVAEAEARGGRIEVPMVDFFKTWGPSNLGQALRDDTSVDPVSLTPREARTEAENVEKQAQSIAAEQGNTAEAFDAHMASYEAANVAAGYTKGEARTAAALYRNFVETAAERFGKHPMEMAASLPMLGAKVGDEAAVGKAPTLVQRLTQRAANATPEERARELYVDPVSGLQTFRAWEEGKHPDGVGVVTIADAKAINDHPQGGHDTTNDLLRHAGGVVAEVAPDAARQGTNFLVPKGQLAEVQARVQAALPVGMRAVSAEGTTTDEAFQALDKRVKGLRKDGTLAERGQTAADLTTLKPEAFRDAVGARPRLTQEQVDRARAMSPAQHLREAYFDKALKGVLSAVGFEATPAMRFVTAIDLKGLRAINEQFGKKLGDDLIAAFAEAAMKVGGEDFYFAHLSGDEFALKADNLSDLEDFHRALQLALRDVGLPATLVKEDAAGNVTREAVRIRPDFRAGVGGETYGNADRALNQAKRAEASGAAEGDGDLGARALPGAESLRQAGVPGSEPGRPWTGGSVSEPGGTGPVVEGLSPERVEAILKERESRGPLRTEERQALEAGFNTPESIASARQSIKRMQAKLKGESKKSESQNAIAALQRLKERRDEAEAFLKWVENSGPRPVLKGMSYSTKMNPEVVRWAARQGLVDPEAGLSAIMERAVPGIDKSMRRGKTNNPTDAYGRAVKQDQRAAFMANVKGEVQNIYGRMFQHDEAKATIQGLADRALGKRMYQQEHQTQTPEFRAWFKASQVVDANGQPLPVFHGAKRPDRIGNVFRRSRATSGPMAFFTDDPAIAGGYATGKADTSLEAPSDYSGWFKYKVGRSEVSVDRAWNFLSGEDRQRLTEELSKVGIKDDGTIYKGDSADAGPGGRATWEMYLRESRGNALKAAVEIWLNAATLFNEEEKFLKVLDLAGMKDVKFDSPHAEYPSIFKVYLAIQHPFDTSAVSQKVADDLEKAARRQQPKADRGVDLWDKNSRDPQVWMVAFRESMQDLSRPSHVWTSIPDWVTKVLKKHGYDGIQDKGGKNGGPTHTVWIPFEETQVKSATGNRGTFDSKSKNILYQKKQPVALWYSQVEKAAESAKQDKNSPAAWWALLQKSPGVKAEELEYMDMKSWLDEQKGSITKAQVLDFIRANRIEVKERILAPLDREATSTYSEAAATLDKRVEQVLGAIEEAAKAAEQDLKGLLFPSEENNAKMEDAAARADALWNIHQQIQAAKEMADNVHDMAWEDGRINKSAMQEMKKHMDRAVDIAEENGIDLVHFLHQADGKNIGFKDFEEATNKFIDSTQHTAQHTGLTLPGPQEQDQGREILLYAPEGTAAARDFQAPDIHYKGELGKGLMMHLRLTVRRLASGERVAVFEEGQSDLHQHARDEGGYERRKKDSGLQAVDPKRLEEVKAELERVLPEVQADIDVLKDSKSRVHGRLITIDSFEEAIKSAKKAVENLEKRDYGWARTYAASAARSNMSFNAFFKMVREAASAADRRENPDTNRTPDAPFKTTWEELALKRFLAYAVEHGFTKVAWTTGQQQADRYSLAEHVDELTWTPHSDRPGTGSLLGRKDGNQVVHQMNVEEKSLPSMIGATAAQALLEGGVRTIRGQQLQIGGEGMKAAYDQRIPALMKKLLKKDGGEVGKERLADWYQSASAEVQRLDELLQAANLSVRAPRLIDRYSAQPAIEGRASRLDAALGQADAVAFHRLPEQTRFDIQNAIANVVMQRSRAGQADNVQGDTVWTATIPASFAERVKEQGQALFQPGDEVPKGYTEPVEVVATRRVINTFFNKSADFSTLVHEPAHAYLEMFRELASRPDAPMSIRVDWATTMEELGLKPGDALTTRAHERWARTWEDYVARGIAPSKKLEGTFTRMKRWILRIYRSIRNIPGALDSPALRGVFDRLLATDEAIARYRSEQGPELGRDIEPMTDAEWAAAKDQEEQQVGLAKNRLDLRVVKEKLREADKTWQAEMKQRMKAAGEAYEAMPARQAQLLLQGKSPKGKPIAMDRAQVEAVIGKKRTAGLTTVAEGGTSPSAVAVLAGYPDAESFLKDLVSLPSKEKWVEATATAGMKEAHPGLLEKREELRTEIVKTLDRFTQEKLAKQAEVLHRKDMRVSRTDMAALQRAAQLIVSRRKLERLDPGTALRQERAAANRKAQAAARQDWQAAGKAAREEALNAFIHRELTLAVEARQKLLDLGKALAQPKARQRLGKASPAFLAAVDYIRAGLGMGPAPTGLGPASLDEAVAQMKGDYLISTEEDPEWLDVLRTAVERGDGWKGLTVEEAAQVKAAFLGIAAAARERTEVKVAGQRAELADIVSRMVEAAKKNKRQQPGMAASPSGERFMRKMALGAQSFEASLTKVEAMMDMLDGGLQEGQQDTRNGIWNQAGFMPLEKARQHEADVLKGVAKPILDALNAIPSAVKKTFHNAIDGKTLFPTWRVGDGSQNVAAPSSLYELYMFALNYGNEGNRQRLLDGFNITEAQVVDAFNKHFTKEAIDWVNSVHRAFAALKPLEFALQERQTGIRPDEVKAIPTTLTAGVLEGGYFPIVKDSRIGIRGQAASDKTLASLMDPTYGRVATHTGHLKARAQRNSDPLLLEPSLIPRHLAQQVHDLAFREALQQTARILLNKDVQVSISNSLGPAYAAQIKQWLKDVGTATGVPATANVAPFVKLLKKLRANVVISAMGYSVTNFAEDQSSIFMSAFDRDIQSWRVAAGVAEFWKNPRAAVRMVDKLSGGMRASEEQLVRDLTENIDAFTASGFKSLAVWRMLKKHAFILIETSFRTTAYPVWIARYRQALAAGESESNAVEAADKLIRRNFPQHSMVNASGLLRDKSSVGLALQFHGMFNTVFGLVMREGHVIAEGEGISHKSKAALRALGVIASIGLIGNFLRGKGPNKGDDEPWDIWVFRQMLGTIVSMVPFMADLGTLIDSLALGHKYNSRSSTSLGSIAEALGQLAKTLNDDNADERKKTAAFLRAGGTLFGVPGANQLIRTGTYVADAYSGDRDVQSILDIMAGLPYGETDKLPANPIRSIADTAAGRPSIPLTRE